MNDLWAGQREAKRAAVAPLADRMRPRHLDEIAGQRHILAEGSLLRRMIDADRLTSLILWGPPGTGKTSMAEAIAATTGREFVRCHATRTGVRELRNAIEQAVHRLERSGERTILFVDEIHRFAKNQQETLLDDVERGMITLIGATTENPTFSVVSALVSRSTVFELRALDPEDIRELIQRAHTDVERGFGSRPLEISEDAIELWASRCDGDARRALTALEVAVLSQQPDATTPLAIDLDIAEQSMQTKAIVYSAKGDNHYDFISAFIKSMRASDAKDALYWMHSMLEAGEDPRFIARRIVIFASEDIGNRDPQALVVAEAAARATERVGMPECRYTLTQAALYMANAPKSRIVAEALGETLSRVRDERTDRVPAHLRNVQPRSDE